VAAVDRLAEELRFVEGEAAWDRLLQRLPTVRDQFADAAPQFPFVHAKRLSFHSRVIISERWGERWAMLPSAAGFVDPLLSTGFPLTLLGVTRLAEALERDWDSDRFESSLREYAARTDAELAAAERLVAALYASMDDFSLFAPLSLLYFAAASFTETARRLGRPSLAGSFLMHDHPVFGPRLSECLQSVSRDLAPERRTELEERIRRAIEPFDVAGLNDRGRRNWYPVEAGHLLGAADKLDASRREIEYLLHRSGFFGERGPGLP
jgi:FADH2 O2-dependent halogenase